MVSVYFGGSKTRTLNRQSSMVQSLVLLRVVPQWYPGGLVAQNPILEIANSQVFKVSYNHGCPSVVAGCFGGSKTRTLNCKSPMVQSLILSGLALTGMWVLWWLRNPYFPSSNSQWFKVTYFQGLPSVVSGWLKNPDFESPILNGSKSHSFRACLQWYVGALVAQKPVLPIPNSQGFKVTWFQRPSLVSGRFGGSQTRTWNRKFSMVQSLIHPRLSLSGILLPWWLKNPYFESLIPNRSKSPTITAVPEWYLGALVAQKPVHCIGNPQWFKVSYFRGLASVVCGCFGASITRTLNVQFPMVQSLIPYF